MQSEANPAGPLKGLRILDLATLIAGPWASTLLADLGADVVKVELPDGRDALRALPPHKDGVPLWWKVANRNKRGITLDVRKPEGRELLLRLLPSFDVLVENFRSGTMDRWGLGKETLLAAQPKLTILRVTGFGQTGPYRAKPGFARVFEAMSGFTYLNGHADGPPLNMGFPLADSVAGLFGALGIIAAAYHRLRHPETPGQEIDLSATEAIFRTLDFLPIEFDQLGVVRERLGNLSAYSAPSNIYGTRDGKWLSMAVSAQSVFERLCTALGRPELVGDVRFTDNVARVRNRDALDAIVASWIAARDLADAAAILARQEISFSPVYTIRDVFDDPHFRERRMIEEVDDPDLGTVKMQCVVPRFSATPGAIRSPGPRVGEHNAQVYGALGLDTAACEALRAKGVI
ncbi:MAG: acyl-CoA transferase [Betaproteobacteria bacterium RIFCSPLOWO2_12_FULL_62_13b]|nr:MAG: acyl-CoA transferase [Betaproteobacteria bacterium RIFCSPLOWO2_12_FULL_62_13b]